MPNHEQANSNQEQTGQTVFRALWDHIRRRRQPPPGTSIAQPSTPETSAYDIHRGRVAAEVLNFFNAVDARFADQIGYEGNIREELYRRLSRTGERNPGLDLKGLDPMLQEHIDSNRFTARLDGEDNDGQWARYSIDCQLGYFTPSVLLQTPDGSLEAKLYHGPERLMFERLHLRRIYDNNQVRHVETFAHNLFSSYGQPHPLMISQGWLPLPTTHAYYDTLDAAGNVSLVDGQPMHHPTDLFTGKYHAAERYIETVLDRRFPYEVQDQRFLLGYPNQQVSVPFETNIYTELNAITSILRAIE